MRNSTRKRIPRTNDYTRTGQRYLLMEQWERDDLVHNFVTKLSECDGAIQERMVWHLLLAEDELGLRVGEGLGISPADVRHLQPLASQDLSPADQERLANLGKTAAGRHRLTMTHWVPNERAVMAK
jgi:catalase